MAFCGASPKEPKADDRSETIGMRTMSPNPTKATAHGATATMLLGLSNSRASAGSSPVSSCMRRRITSQ